MGRTISRRQLMKTSAAAAAISIVPRHVLGQGQTPPSEKITLAAIGCGGQAGADLGELAKDGAVPLALCDVDQKHGEQNLKKFASTRHFKDFRRMLDEVGSQVDAVLVGTPDHTHSVAAMAAIKRGKHVYCEKPLAHSIWEVRQLMKAAQEKKVVTQLGNQGHSTDSIRRFCEWIRDGAIGQVHTIHAGCKSNYSRINALGKLNEQHEVPPTLDWDLWLGPAAYRPYNPMYLPGVWRGWTAFGTGVIGDWTCHVIDPVYWALDLGAPATITANAKGYDPVAHAETFPAGSVVKYEFPARGARGPVTLYWHDGVESLPRPEGLEKDRTVPDIGAIVLGDKGGITYGSHGAGGVRIYPESKMKAYKQPARSIPRTAEHHKEFLNAIREGRKADSDFAAYGGGLTEIALLGIIAIRCLGNELKWDSANMRFTNSDRANSFLRPKFREGWSL